MENTKFKIVLSLRQIMAMQNLIIEKCIPKDDRICYLGAENMVFELELDNTAGWVKMVRKK
jgi:hypothetical protein